MKTFQIACSGYTVDADWYDGQNPDEILLTLIGWTSNRKRYGDILPPLIEKTGMSALVFDYSGHGDSKLDLSKTRPAQHFLEVIYVFDWLKEQYPNAKITVMGTSYGGFMATQLTKYREFDRLILRVPAIYRPEDFYTLNSQLNSDEGWAAKAAYRKDAEALAKHPLLARAARFKGKSLVIVHEHDQSVPTETTDAYIKTFGADVYLAKGFPHGFHEAPQELIPAYLDNVAGWLSKL